MLHRLSFAPFPDTATETWFAALGDALEAAGAEGLLLANLLLEAAVLPAVVVLPGRVAILRAPSAPAGALPDQQAALAQWLGTWPELPAVPAAAIAGFTVLTASEGVVSGAAEPNDWAVVSAPQLAEELQARGTEAGLITPVLHRWADSLTEEDPAAATSQQQEEEEPAGFWEQKARQLWGWLGAEDVPADPPYGTAAVPTNNAAEQQRLELLRRQMLTELQQQRQEMEAREAAREHSIAQLRQQLAATPSAATEVAALQARLTAETQEKNRLAAAIEAARTEAEVRNRELEARMQQLGQQVAQLQTRPATAEPAPGAAGSPLSRPASRALPPVGPTLPAAGQRGAAPKPAPARRPAPGAWRLHWPRVVLVLLMLGVVGAGGWAVQRYSRQLLSQQKNQRPSRPAEPAQEPATDENLEAAAPTLFDIQPDTIRIEAEEADSDQQTEPADSQPGEVMDSVVAPEEGI